MFYKKYKFNLLPNYDSRHFFYKKIMVEMHFMIEKLYGRVKKHIFLQNK